MKRKQRKREQADLGTPETRAKLQRDPLDYMAERWKKKYGAQDAIELQESGAEIRRLFRYTVGPLTPRAVDLSAIKTASHNAPEWLAARKLDVYNPWAIKMGWRMPIVLAWLIDEKPMYSIDKSKYWRKGKTSEIIVYALYEYCYTSGRLKRHQMIT